MGKIFLQLKTVMADITYSIDKANFLNSYYACAFSCKRLSVIGRNKSIGLDGIPGKILKLGGKAMIPYLGHKIYNATIPRDWKRGIVVPIYKGGDRSIVTKYRPVSLTSLVCKQMEQVIAEYLRQVWYTNWWLYEGQYGFRLGYSCKSQIITVCQDIANFLDEGARIDAIIIYFSKASYLVCMIGCLWKLQPWEWIQG